MRTRLLIPLLLLTFLPGCASFERWQEPSADIQPITKVWVRRNNDDNRGLEDVIVKALREKGYEVESGHLTMMPVTYRAVLSFEDRWSWDFRDHLVYLRFTLRDARSSRLLATATWSQPSPLAKNIPESIGRLADELFAKAGQSGK
jgi:hypothetical protein